jgi:hypothetical protein
MNVQLGLDQVDALLHLGHGFEPDLAGVGRDDAGELDAALGDQRGNPAQRGAWARETTRAGSQGSVRSKTSPTARPSSQIGWASGSGRPSRAFASARSNVSSRVGSAAVEV